MTALKPDFASPIDVHGELYLNGPVGRPLRLKAEGSQLYLAVPGWAELHRLGPRSLLVQRRRLAAAIRSLRKLRLTLDIDVNGHRAFGLGAGVKTSLLARLLGLTSTDIGLPTVVKLLRSRAALHR